MATIRLPVHPLYGERVEVVARYGRHALRVEQPDRLMTKVTAIAGEAGTTLRDRTRSVKYRLLEIGRASRTRGGPAQEKLQALYRRLLATTGRVAGCARRPIVISQIGPS